MSDYFAASGARPEQAPSGMRLAALVAVVAGVVLLAAAAFVFSYSGIHQLARNSGVTPVLARMYPLIFDAMLVIAGAAVLALRGAGWWTRSYVWFCLLLLLTGVAAGDAVRAMHVSLPARPSRAVVAVTPWVLVLLAFGMWLAMLRHLRRVRKGPGEARTTGAIWTGSSTTGTVRTLPPPRTGPDNGLGTNSETPRPATGPRQPATVHDPAATGDKPAAAAPEPADGSTNALPATGAAEGPPPEPSQPPESPKPADEDPPSLSFDRMRSTPTPPQD